MNDYPLRVKIVANIAIVLAYIVGLPVFGLMYAAGYWADRWCRLEDPIAGAKDAEEAAFASFPKSGTVRSQQCRDVD